MHHPKLNLNSEYESGNCIKRYLGWTKNGKIAKN